jgi:hypothetical protein
MEKNSTRGSKNRRKVLERDQTQPELESDGKTSKMPYVPPPCSYATKENISRKYEGKLLSDTTQGFDHPTSVQSSMMILHAARIFLKS